MGVVARILVVGSIGLGAGLGGGYWVGQGGLPWEEGRADRAADALERAGLKLPPLPLQCTLVLSRRVFGDHRGTFAASRKAAGVEPEDDAATAVARVVLAAQRAVRNRCGR